MKVILIIVLFFSFAQIKAQKINSFLSKVDSTKDDISYYIYLTKLDTTPPALEYSINSLSDIDSINFDKTVPVDTEPTFRDRYFKNIEIDTTGEIFIAKAITAREIARNLLIERYGIKSFAEAGELIITLVDYKYWMISCNIWKNSFGGTVLIIISRYDGRIITWTNI
jgi:hypothetical protein